MICENLGNRIYTLRKEKQLSRDELAARANISTNYLGMIERGQRPQLSIKVIDDLSQALGISLSDLFRNIEDSENQEAISNAVVHDAYYKEIIDVCYPREHSQYHVSSLLKFLLYLPLIDPVHLMDTLDKLGGSLYAREDRALKMIDDCIKHIPPSPALSFAQAEEKKLSRALILRRFAAESLTPEECEVLFHKDPDGQAAYEQTVYDAKEFYGILKKLESFYSKAQ